MKIYDLWFDYEQDKGNTGKLLELLKSDPAAFKAEFELCDQDAEGGETSLQWLQRELRMKPEEQHDVMYKFVHAWKTMMQKRGRCHPADTVSIRSSWRWTWMKRLPRSCSRCPCLRHSSGGA